MAEYVDMSALAPVAKAISGMRSDLQDHLDVAAAEAIEIAGELTRDRVASLDSRAAQHLQYMAGLIRGCATAKDEKS